MYYRCGIALKKQGFAESSLREFQGAQGRTRSKTGGGTPPGFSVFVLRLLILSRFKAQIVADVILKLFQHMFIMR